MLTFAFLSGVGGAISANSTQILAVWLVLEQYLASNDKIKANSTFQLVSGLIKAVLKK